jgi:transcriptional regulator with XRE-family HTH domain
MEKILSRISECQGRKTASKFATLLGMSQQSVHNYLSEKRKLSLDFIISVCCKCHVSADWLLGFTDDPKGTAAPATDPTLAALIAEKDAEIARLKGKIEGLELAFKAFGKGE